MSRTDLLAQAAVPVYSGSRLCPPSPPRRRLGPAQACARETYLVWQEPRQRRRCSALLMNTVVHVIFPCALAARDRRVAVAMEAGQAGSAICVGVTVAHAQVAFSNATPFPTEKTFRELWHHAVSITSESAARAARDRRIAKALEAGQAGFAICIGETVAHAHVAFFSATQPNVG